MKHKKKMFALGSLLGILTSCGAPKGYLSYDEISSKVSSFSDLSYTTYSYEGYFNCRGLEGDFGAQGNNVQFSNDKTSYYLSLPLKLESENLETQYQTIVNKFVTSDSIDTVYCYDTSDDGLVFRTFGINKRLIISRFGMEISAKWNAYITYDSNGYLISEKFETINVGSDPDSQTVYGYTTYSYN